SRVDLGFFVQRIKRAGDGDVHQARALAATAAGAAEQAVDLLDVLRFAHEAVPDARRLAVAEVVTARDQRELVKLARVPLAVSLPILHRDLALVLHVEAEAGRADVG